MSKATHFSIVRSTKAEKSYNNCIQDELIGLIENEIGRQPPPLAKDEKRMCKNRFDVSTAQNGFIHILCPSRGHSHGFASNRVWESIIGSSTLTLHHLEMFVLKSQRC